VVLPRPLPDGATNARIKVDGMDQTVKIRGMFVHSRAGRCHCQPATKARLVVTGEMANDSTTLLVETSAAPSHSEGEFTSASARLTAT
jgi:phenylacetate-CoA ligase